MNPRQKSHRQSMIRTVGAFAALGIAAAGQVSAQAVGGWIHGSGSSTTSSRTASPSPQQNQTYFAPVRRMPSPVQGQSPVNSFPAPGGYAGTMRQIEPSNSGVRYPYPAPVRVQENEPPVQTYSNEGQGVIHSSGGLYSTVVQGREIQPGRPEQSIGAQEIERPSGRFTGPQGPVQERPSIRIITPQGPTPVFVNQYGGGYFYSSSPSVRVALHGPPLLGGYYYSNYCDGLYESYTYPSIYSVYDNFPLYIYNPNVIVLSQPYCPYYVTSYQPFEPPVYQVTYNQNNYYVASPDRVREFNEGGDQAQQAIENAYPADSYQAAFADIEKAWADGSVTPIKKHLRDTDSKISVFLNTKYSYSIASGDYAQITRDALDHLNTSSFAFTKIRKAKSGDVTAYGKHVYQTSSSSDQSNDSSAGDEKTVYVSYTLRHRNGQWYIVAIDSSKDSLTPQDN